MCINEGVIMAIREPSSSSQKPYVPKEQKELAPSTAPLTPEQIEKITQTMNKLSAIDFKTQQIGKDKNSDLQLTVQKKDNPLIRLFKRIFGSGQVTGITHAVKTIDHEISTHPELLKNKDFIQALRGFETKISTSRKNTKKLQGLSTIQKIYLKTDTFAKLKKAHAENDLRKICEEFTSATINISDERGRTPLHYVALKGKNPELIQYLIDKGADVDAKDNDGNTPLHLAAKEQNKEAVVALVKPYQNLSSVQLTNLQGNTPLHLAVELGLTDVCKALRPLCYSRIHPLSYNHSGETIWHLIAKRSQQGSEFVAMVDAFGHDFLTITREGGGNVLLKENKQNLTPLDLAAMNLNLGVLSILFNQFSDLPFEDLRGGVPSPLKLADISGQMFLSGTKGARTTFVHRLLEKCLDEGVELERVSTALYIIATTRPDLMRVKDDEGQTPFEKAKSFMAKGKQIPPDILYYLEKPEEVQMAAKKMHQDAQLKEMSLRDQLLMLKARIQEGMNESELKEAANKLDEIQKQCTPPSVSNPYVDPKLLKEMHEKATDAEGNNYWHLLADPAKEKNQQPMISGWLGQGSKEKLYAKNNAGLTPIHIAIQKGNRSFLDVLFDPERRYNIDWNHPHLSNLLAFALDQLATSDPKEVPDRIQEIVLLIGKAPGLVTKEVMKKYEGMQPLNTPLFSNLASYLQSPGKAKSEQQLHKSQVAYVQERTQASIDEIEKKLRMKIA